MNLVSLLRSAAFPVALLSWVVNPGCRCYGGDPTDPNETETDDDSSIVTDDDDITYTDVWTPPWDPTGFYLELGRGEGSAWEGLWVAADGALFAWTGQPGQHQSETWRATLTHDQMYSLYDGLEEGGFFSLQSKTTSGTACTITGRYQQSSNEVSHDASQSPEALVGFYEALSRILIPFDLEPGCGAP